MQIASKNYPISQWLFERLMIMTKEKNNRVIELFA